MKSKKPQHALTPEMIEHYCKLYPTGEAVYKAVEEKFGNIKVTPTEYLTIRRHLNSDNRLSEGLEKAASLVKKLTIVGLLTDDDFKFIKSEMQETLQELDMTDAYTDNGKIPDGAFKYCKFTTVKLPSAVTEIGFNAFGDCKALTTVTFGNAVTKIADFAFMKCRSLTSVIIPDTVTEIGQEVFTLCEALNFVALGASVTTIGDEAFSDCPALTAIHIPAATTNVHDNAFARSPTAITVHPDNPVYESIEGKLRRINGKSRLPFTVHRSPPLNS